MTDMELMQEVDNEVAVDTGDFWGNVLVNVGKFAFIAGAVAVGTAVGEGITDFRHFCAYKYEQKKAEKEAEAAAKEEAKPENVEAEAVSKK